MNAQQQHYYCISSRKKRETENYGLVRHTHMTLRANPLYKEGFDHRVLQKYFQNRKIFRQTAESYQGGYCWLFYCNMCALPYFPMSAHLTFGALLPCYTPIYHVSFCYENTRRKPGSPLTRRASLCLVLNLSTHGLDVSLFIECIYLFLKSPVRRASFASRDIEYCRYYSFLLDIANLSQIG